MMEGGVLFFVIAILSIFAVSWIFFRDVPHLSSQHKENNKIPRRIWTYQDSEVPTVLQSRCYETWRAFHPDYEIQILTPATYQGYVRIPERHSVPLWRDIERWEEALTLYTLAEHGGLWLDSRTQLHGSVDEWLFPTYGECAGFYWKKHTAKTQKTPKTPETPETSSLTKTTNPFMDRRCIACNKKSVFIQRWKEEVERLLGHSSVDSYLRSIFTATPLTDFTIPHTHLAAFSLQHVLLHRPYPMESILLHPVEEGPLAHYEEGRGDKKKAMAIGLGSLRPIVFLEE